MELIASADPLTGGTIIGAIGVGLILMICAAVAVWGWKTEDMDGGLAVVGAILAALITVGIWFWAMWPFSYEYHHWIQTEGTVEAVGKRIVSDGDGGINEKYVIRFDDGRVRALNDTIGGQLRKGDIALLRCKRAYDFGVPRSSHGWDCKWSGRRA